jgi:hypothetical protein
MTGQSNPVKVVIAGQPEQQRDVLRKVERLIGIVDKLKIAVDRVKDLLEDIKCEIEEERK